MNGEPIYAKLTEWGFSCKERTQEHGNEDTTIFILPYFREQNNKPEINSYGKGRTKSGKNLFEFYEDDYNKNYRKKRFFFLTYISETNFGDLSNKYVLSIEPISGIKNSNTILSYKGSIEDLKSKLEDGIKNKKSCVCVDGECNERDYYLRFIRVMNEDGTENWDILKHYLELSDSRTYKDTVYYPVYKSVLSSPDESNDELLPYNLLVYGAPGTGKSHYINTKFEERFLKQLDNYKPFDVSANKQLTEEDFKKMSDKYKEEFGEEMSFKSDDNSSPNNQIYKAQNDFRNKYLTRVTFYEDYSYENFVGCYKPIKKDDKITYEFEAGPFIDIYIKAKENPDNPYLLAVEEINRADAAAVFGDLFQVLDRDNDGSSEYSVKPEVALNKYLEEHLPNYDGTISLPSNLYIWATMNSADQGVHVLDSAFKRRWQFLYMDIDNSPSSAKADGREIVLPFGNNKIKTYAWGSFRNAVNEVLEKNNIEEDRWVGAWFFKDEELDLINKFYENKDNTKLKPNPLVDKLLAYLLQDVVKMNKDILFKTDYHNMSSIRKALSNSEANIFDVLTQKINIDKKEDEDIADKREIVLPVGDNKTETYTWGSFRKAVNEVLEKNNIEKDRQIEAWFFKGRELKSIETFYKEKGTDNKDNPLVDKLLEQLSKINKDIFKQGYSDISSVHGDLSNSVSPKSIFEVLNIDKNALEKVQETENPTPTNAESAPNGQQTQAVTENG